MKTYSHLLIGAVLHEAANGRGAMGHPFLYGAVAPDLPLWLMFAWSVGTATGLRGQSLCEAVEVFSANYFQDPWRVAGHNLLHSPASLLMVLAFVRLGVWLLSSRRCGWEQATGFLLGCMVHAAIDILTHYDDGPLLFWPLDWETRFPSPVSHWDPAHHGIAMTVMELVLDIVLLSWLASHRCCRRLLHRFGLNPA